MKFRDLLNESYNKELGMVYFEAKDKGDIKGLKSTQEFMLDFDYKGASMNVNMGTTEKEIEKNFAKLFNKGVIPFANGVDQDGEEVEYSNIKVKDIKNISYEVN